MCVHTVCVGPRSAWIDVARFNLHQQAPGTVQLHLTNAVLSFHDVLMIAGALKHAVRHAVLASGSLLRQLALALGAKAPVSHQPGSRSTPSKVHAQTVAGPQAPTQDSSQVEVQAAGGTTLGTHPLHHQQPSAEVQLSQILIQPSSSQGACEGATDTQPALARAHPHQTVGPGKASMLGMEHWEGPGALRELKEEWSMQEARQQEPGAAGVSVSGQLPNMCLHSTANDDERYSSGFAVHQSLGGEASRLQAAVVAASRAYWRHTIASHRRQHYSHTSHHSHHTSHDGQHTTQHSALSDRDAGTGHPPTSSAQQSSLVDGASNVTVKMFQGRQVRCMQYMRYMSRSSRFRL